MALTIIPYPFSFSNFPISLIWFKGIRLFNPIHCYFFYITEIFRVLSLVTLNFY